MILLDGMMQIWRANAKLTELVTRDGRHTGMEFGFLKSLEALRRVFDDDIIVCWEGKHNFRYKIFPEYKANRRKKQKESDDNCVTRVPLDYKRVNEFKEFLSLIVDTAQDDELEADDVIATLAKRYSQTEKVIIYSGDKDLFQLLQRQPFPVVQVRAFAFRDTPWNVGRINKEFHGLQPTQLAEYFAFIGDDIDNIKGVKARAPLIGSALREGYSPDCLSDFELFSAKEITALDNFYASGLFQRNLKLIQLKDKKEIKVVKKDWRKEDIAIWLKSMEFRTLDLCKECGLEFVVESGEEF